MLLWLKMNGLRFFTFKFILYIMVSEGFNRQSVEKKRRFFQLFYELKQLFDVLELLESELIEKKVSKREISLSG